MTGRWNPLACRGTALPMELLLLAKLLAIPILATQFWRTLPEPYLAFLPLLEGWPAGWVRFGLMGLLVISSTALLFNFYPRLAAFGAGVSILLAVASSRLYYGNNHTLVGLVFVFIGLYSPRWGKWPLRLQISLVYFGAGLNKLLDADWRSGQFFAQWTAWMYPDSALTALQARLPELALGKAICWGTIATELSLAPLLLIPRTRTAAIWLSILFHTGLTVFTGKTFGLFLYVMLASMLAVADWPRGRPLVIYDGDCGLCNATRRLMQWLDRDRFLDWRPLQSGVGEQFGLSRAALTQRAHLVAEGPLWAGFRAARTVLLLLPVTYFALLLAIMGGDRILDDGRRIVVPLMVLLFSPLMNPAGEWVYGWVARNRYWLWPGSQCEVTPKQ